jgi:hypothetical protein
MGRSDGGGGSRPGKFRGGRSREGRQSSLVAAARRTATPARTDGVAAGSFALFLLPNGWPRLRPLDPLGIPAPAPPKALVDDMGGEGDVFEKLREPLGEEEE